MKKRWLSAALALQAFAGFRPEIANARPEPQAQDIGGAARALFATKCTGCHGPDLAKPKGRFGYVLDLERIAANPEMVIPFRPDESELWELVHRDEMPPADSPQGTLSREQKELIRAWIAAGAPGASPDGLDPAPSVQSEATAPALVPTSERIVRWVGKFHLLMIHFPIALSLAAGIAEVWSVKRRNPIPSEVVRFCLWLGALLAIPTVGLGWLFAAAGHGVGSPQLLTAHRWLGTTAAMWLLITAVCSECDTRRGVRNPAVRLLLMSGVLLTALSAHAGGLLAHGEDFFTY
jgi:mono/diheme cytochrome c family protein